MRAVSYTQTGPADTVLELGERPAAEPGAGEVRVAVAWSGVNPSDVKTRAGARTKTLPFERIVPHSDGAGVIDAVGEGVDPARVGERVWLWNAAWGRPDGTAAEYVVLPAQQAVKLPDGVDLEVGACMGIPGLTAYHAVHVNGGVAGQTVLVAGGAGAVGYYAIQMARLDGAAIVITTVSSEEKAAVAREAGADTVINYRTEDVVDRVKALTGGKGVDRIIEVEFSGNAAKDLDMIRADGQIVVYGSDAPTVEVPFMPSIVKNVCVQFFIVYNLDDDARRRSVNGVNRLLEAGALSHRIARRLPLEQCAEAHRLVEERAVIGNVVVSPGPVQA